MNNNKFVEKFNPEIYRQRILFLLRNDKEKIAKKIIRQIANKKYIQNNDINGLYDFFSPIYDELFYDLMFENIKVSSQTKELLETLSLPFFKMERQRQEDIIKSFQ